MIDSLEIKKLVRRAKEAHKRQIKKFEFEAKTLKRNLEITRKKYKALQKKHNHLHQVNSKLRRQVKIHELTLQSIAASLQLEVVTQALPEIKTLVNRDINESVN